MTYWVRIRMAKNGRTVPQAQCRPPQRVTMHFQEKTNSPSQLRSLTTSIDEFIVDNLNMFLLLSKEHSRRSSVTR